MAKIRIYEVARQFDVSSEAMVNLLHEMDVPVKNHMSSIDEQTVERVRAKFDQEKEAVKHAEEEKKKKLEEAKKARKMKDVARYRQRLGHLYHVNRQPEQAMASYEEAFRIDPTNVATMVGLGNLYVDRKEWEKAKRVYRSLVLQKIDPSSGITMGEAYYRLGLIHIETGEKDKAKGMFQRALDIEPQNQAYKQALARL